MSSKPQDAPNPSRHGGGAASCLGLADPVPAVCGWQEPSQESCLAGTGSDMLINTLARCWQPQKPARTSTFKGDKENPWSQPQ